MPALTAGVLRFKPPPPPSHTCIGPFRRHWPLGCAPLAVVLFALPFRGQFALLFLLHFSRVLHAVSNCLCCSFLALFFDFFLFCCFFFLVGFFRLQQKNVATKHLRRHRFTIFVPRAPFLCSLSRCPRIHVLYLCVVSWNENCCCRSRSSCCCTSDRPRPHSSPPSPLLLLLRQKRGKK